MSFKEWYENADMPEKDKDGNWVDLETGHAYKSSYTTSTLVSDKTLEIRKEAKKFGANALKGTLKQKEWAEKIRLEFFKKFSDELKCFYSFLDKAQQAKMWIEMRNDSVQSFENKMKMFHEINDEIRKLNFEIMEFSSNREKSMEIRKEMMRWQDKGNNLFYRIED